MRLINLLAASLAMGFMGLANAHNVLSPKTVSIPFTNETISSEDHEGLDFDYNLSGGDPKSIVCEFSNTYKAWLEYTNQSVMEESATFGGSPTMIISHLGSKKLLSENIQLLVADLSGHMQINDDGEKSTASCHYYYKE